ncbi:MAG: MBL fold metallo-hydrolase [Clostridia bacterium]|nr:MBL fold metallo-hydrolase [Clostridia bacterium]
MYLNGWTDAPLPYGQAQMWWLGQMGLFVKLGSTLVSLDYFASPRDDRTVPPPIPAQEVRGVAAFLGTHDHLDHIDHEAWAIFHRVLPEARFVCPATCVKRVLMDEIAPERILPINEGEALQIGDITIRAIAAAHEFLDPDPLTGCFPALQYILEGNGIRIYHAGDTVRYEGMLPKLQAMGDIDIAMLPINGRDAVRYRRNCIGNMTFQEAVDLTGALHPRLVLPGHWDMFRENSEDPEKFRDYLDAKYPGQTKCLIPSYLERIDYQRG